MITALRNIRQDTMVNSNLHSDLVALQSPAQVQAVPISAVCATPNQACSPKPRLERQPQTTRCTFQEINLRSLISACPEANRLSLTTWTTERTRCWRGHLRTSCFITRRARSRVVHFQLSLRDSLPTIRHLIRSSSQLSTSHLDYLSHQSSSLRPWLKDSITLQRALILLGQYDYVSTMCSRDGWSRTGEISRIMMLWRSFNRSPARNLERSFPEQVEDCLNCHKRYLRQMDPSSPAWFLPWARLRPLLRNISQPIPLSHLST